MGLLAIAGALSGAGDAAVKGLNTAQAGMIQSQLIKERDDLENRRLALMEQYAMEREGRGETRAIAAEGRAEQRVIDSEERAIENKKKEAQAAIDVNTDPANVAKVVNAEHLKKLGANQDEAATIKFFSDNKDYLDGLTKIEAAKESPAAKVDAEIKRFQLTQSKEVRKLQDALVKATASGDEEAIRKAKDAYEAFAAKPWELDRADATASAAGLKEAGNEITRLSVLLEKALPGTPEHSAIQRMLDNATRTHAAYNARLQQLTGAAGKTAPPKPATDIGKIDPFKPDQSVPEPRGLIDTANIEITPRNQPKSPPRRMITVPPYQP